MASYSSLKSMIYGGQASDRIDPDDSAPARWYYSSSYRSTSQIPGIPWIPWILGIQGTLGILGMLGMLGVLGILRILGILGILEILGLADRWPVT